jgi:hypothetical protein
MDDYYFYIFISIVLLITILSYSVETFKEHLDYGNYTREQTLGTFVPNNQKENMDTYNIAGKEKNNFNVGREDEELSVPTEKLDWSVSQYTGPSNYGNIIYNDNTINSHVGANGNYIFDASNHLPYGGFIYDRSYPVYLAKQVCPEDAPYYDTMNGLCVPVNSTPSNTITDESINQELIDYMKD